MSAAGLLTDLLARGARVRTEGSRVRIEWPRGAVPMDLATRVMAQKEELRQLVEAQGLAGRTITSGWGIGLLEKDWSMAMGRAVAGFAAANRVPTSEDLTGAAAFVLRMLDGRVSPATGHDLSTAIYQGRLVARLVESGDVRVFAAGDGPEPEPLPRPSRLPAAFVACAGCGDAMTAETTSVLCFACDLGITEAAEPPGRVRVAIALRERHGPAGGRGLRKDAIDTEMRRQKEERKGARLGRATRPTGAQKEE